jgi:hypothetical protein
VGNALTASPDRIGAMSDRGRLVGPAGPAPPRCRLAGLLLALLAVLATLWSHPVLFDLRPLRLPVAVRAAEPR